MKQAICCTNMYDTKMTLQVNVFRDGFTDLLWNKDGAEKVYRFSLKKDTVTIAGFVDGYYNFSVRNPQNMLETEPITVYFKRELPSYVINRLWNSANLEATAYTIALKNSLLEQLELSPSSSLLQLLWYRYQNIVDLEEFEEDIFYKLIICQETYENLQNSNLNREGAGFARLTILPVPQIIIPALIDTVKVYDISKKQKTLCQVYRPDDNVLTVPLTVGLFEIQLLQGSYLCSVLKHCNLSDRCMIKLWEDYQEHNMSYLDTIENNLSSSMNFNDFAVEEVANYKEEISMNNVNAVIPRVKVVEEQYLRSVNLVISGVSFASISQHTFFVSGRDVEFLSEKVQNEFIPLIGNSNVFTASFEPANCMIDKEALLYVVDEQGTIVSRVTRCLFDEDSTTSLTDYYEKIRQAEINSYGRRFLSQILTTYPEGWSYAQEMITRCLEDIDINIDNIMLTLLGDISNAPQEVDKDLFSIEVLKDFIASSQYNLSFFSDAGITWRPTTYTLISEPSETGYVLCIMAKFEGNKTYSVHYIHSFTDQALEVLLNKYGTYIIYAISELDYTYSGFVYLNTVTGFLKSYLVNLEVR